MWVAASLYLDDGLSTRTPGAAQSWPAAAPRYDWSRVDVCREDASPLASSAAGAAAPYAACKLALQNLPASYGTQEKLSIAWGRIFALFGPGEHPERLVASVVRSLLLNQEARCSHGRQVRNFLHVADVGEAFAALLDSPLQGPVNIGSPERVSIAALVERIAKRIGRTDLVRLGARASSANEPAILVPDVCACSTMRWAGGPCSPSMRVWPDTISWWQEELVRGSPSQHLPA